MSISLSISPFVGENQSVPWSVLNRQEGQFVGGIQEDAEQVRRGSVQFSRKDLRVARGQGRAGEGHGEREQGLHHEAAKLVLWNRDQARQ